MENRRFGIRQRALSYFVGGDPDFPDDKGFALKPWARVWYENNAAENGIRFTEISRITMGNVYLADYQGNEIMVDKTFVFRLCRDQQLRLCVHKSAMPRLTLRRKLIRPLFQCGNGEAGTSPDESSNQGRGTCGGISRCHSTQSPAATFLAA